MKRNITIYTLLCLLFLGVLACVDDRFYSQDKIGEGVCVIEGTVKFKSFTPALSVNTRAAGDAIKQIKSLCVLLYDESQALQKKYHLTSEEAGGDGVFSVSDVDRSDYGGRDEEGERAESQTPRATFRLAVPYGKYYIYAVANMGNLSEYEENIQTVDGLKSISLQWDNSNVKNNCQMFGHFYTSSSSRDAELITISGSTQKLQAWVRRAASKVTVAFDGSQLADDVSIYIKSVSIKDIPSVCYLGKESAIVNGSDRPEDDYGTLIPDGETLEYGIGEANDAWPKITNANAYCYYDKVSKKGIVEAKKNDENAKKAHDESNDALFFYENMQGEGEDKRQKDVDGDGRPDEKKEKKDGKPYGTYIEVEAYYNSENPEGLGRGTIKYRFMLGKNVTTDYNAERNFHYKLTLIFKRFANDPDWHIDLVRYFEVTQPKDVNYKGEFFTPDYSYGNLGYNFSKHNTVTVTSVEETVQTGEKNELEWKIFYKDLSKGETDFTATKCDWLETTIGGPNANFERKVTFEAKSDYEEIDIDEKLRKATVQGTSTSPKNLANEGGITNAYDIECTANCYMVGAPGWYSFPLVYGNALHNGQTNANAYTYSGSPAENILSVFVNHLDNPITDPYIKKNDGCTPQSAALVWQDERDLVTNISYDATLYGGMGGIKFQVDQANIKQGNAVIAIKDINNVVMWSWHIWVTRFDFEKTIMVTGHDETRKFELMPVNLGWCSDHGDKIKYYKERECEIKFVAGDMERIIKIKQHPHTALPRGNNPYYQWGRKDPFIGTNMNFGNKPRWDGEGKYYSEGSENNPPRLTRDDKGTTLYDEERLTTRQALGTLIKNPDKWHNPPRVDNGGFDWEGNPTYNSDNKTYDNLWQGRTGINFDDISLKTVYDPCPVGYQLSSVNTFRGFTENGEGVLSDGYQTLHQDFGVPLNAIPVDNPKENLFEFYTDKSKLQSIIFPETGYRDWDSFAGIYHFPYVGYIWLAGNIRNDDNKAYDFMYSRNHTDWENKSFVRPKDSFYPCDGFPIRPSLYEKHTEE